MRDIDLSPEIATRLHEERQRQFVHEGYAYDAHPLGLYAARRRRAILLATILDLEARLTGAVLDVTDKLIGGLFARARNATRRRYAASVRDVGRLMRLFHGMMDALTSAHADELDVFEAADGAVGRPKLLHAPGDVEILANLAGEDPLLRAADR